MSNTDTRWHQRLENFKKAFSELSEAFEITTARELTKLEKQGLIQAFEYTHELAWNTIRDYFIDQGRSDITGSKDATRAAFKFGLIKNGEHWMDMIKSRNLTSHTYNQETANTIVSDILNHYFQEFKELISQLESKK